MSDSQNHYKTSFGDTFFRLWVSRHSAYAVQQPDGCYLKVDKPLTVEVIQKHLKGEITVGLYQLDKANMVKWLVFDLDPEKIEDPSSTAKLIIRECVLKPTIEKPRFYRKSVLLEASRHPDPSYHVWVFFEPSPVPAKVARWLALKILEHANINPKLVEVFPKQTELTKHRPYGNLVKAPLGLHRAANKWSYFLDFETLKPLPCSCIFNVQGVSFPESDLAVICRFEEKKHVQTAFGLPKNFKPLSDKEEEKAVRFLCKYWREGARNRLEMYFLGLCLNKGVSFESAKRIIEEVTTRTNDPEKPARLDLVAYHYRNRMNVSLKGSSGIREIIEETR